MVDLEDIKMAHRRLQGLAAHTPLVLCPRSDSERFLYFKPESFQPVGSFKLRGAYNKIASLSERREEPRGYSLLQRQPRPRGGVCGAQAGGAGHHSHAR